MTEVEMYTSIVTGVDDLLYFIALSSLTLVVLEVYQGSVCSENYTMEQV